MMISENRKIDTKILERVHKHSFCNKEELLKAKKCGCFYCERIYETKKIVEWLKEDNGDYTAFCPYCHIDSVIAESDKYELNEELLKDMYDYWMDRKHGEDK